MTKEELEQWHDRAYLNKDKLDIVNSCFYCGCLISPGTIVQYTDNGETALCPIYKTDTIIPGNKGEEFLRAMNRYWICNQDIEQVAQEYNAIQFKSTNNP